MSNTDYARARRSGKGGAGLLAQPFFDCLLPRQGQMPPVRLGPLYEIALVVKGVAEYVGPVHFIPVPDWYIVPPLTQTDEVGLKLRGMSHSYEQIEELLALLKSLPGRTRCDDAWELEGICAGVIVCPRDHPLCEWQPPVWGGEGAAPFGGLWKAEVASRIVANHYNRISESLLCGPEQYVPLYEVDDDSGERCGGPGSAVSNARCGCAPAHGNGLSTAVRLKPQPRST